MASAKPNLYERKSNLASEKGNKQKRTISESSLNKNEPKKVRLFEKAMQFWEKTNQQLWHAPCIKRKEEKKSPLFFCD